MGLVAWDEVCHLGKAINHYKDGVLVPLSSWQTKYEIYANIFPWETWNQQSCVKALRKGVTLGHLTHYTPLDHFLYILIYARPKIVLLKHNKRLLFPIVAG